MNAEFRLPDLGEGLPEAEIVQWLVAEGDEVTLNQPIAEVETAKAIVELPSPFAGTVQTLHAAAGDVVAVGSPLIVIAVPGDEPTAASGGTAAHAVAAASGTVAEDAAGQTETRGRSNSKATRHFWPSQSSVAVCWLTRTIMPTRGWRFLSMKVTRWPTRKLARPGTSGGGLSRLGAATAGVGPLSGDTALGSVRIAA